jgi:hypothetical protein
VSRSQFTFLLLICVQVAHSIEEYLGRLWEVFPAARFVTGLISENRQLGFIVFNAALIAFGFWCFFFPVLRRWPSANLFVGFWIVIELINGIGHPLWSIQQGGYTPGLITAPLLLILAVALLWQWFLTRIEEA